MPKRLGPSAATTLTELAGCIMIGTACAFMWCWFFTPLRAVFYLIAVILAFMGGGFRPRLSRVGSLFLLVGGLYILKALIDPPLPKLVLSDIGNIVLGFSVLSTFGLSDFTLEAWQRFQLRVHRTVLLVSTLGALLGLAKLFYYNLGGIVPSIMDPDRGYPLGSSLRMDYNFYSLPLLLGLLSAFWLMKRDSSALWSNGALLCIPELVGAVLLSGSRRGLITVICALPLLILWLIFGRRHNPSSHAAGLSWKTVTAGLCLVTVLCALKLDALTEFASDLTSADSFSDVMSRWSTIEEGTYSDTRMHYWTITVQRLSRFKPLEWIFGEGFAYVTDLGADSDLPEDYPHNFLLSSLLYGGLLQTGGLVAMISIALTRLSARAQSSGMFAAWFILVILFLSTSCNSFFSSEIAVLLTIVGLNVNRFIPNRRGIPLPETSLMMVREIG